MKNQVFITSVLLLLGCSEDFVPDNPVDPANPDYIPPLVSITSGPAEGEVVEATTVTFTWQGNETAMLYKFKFDAQDWSGWVSAMSKTFDYLDEGSHRFRLQAKYTTGDTSEVIPVNFVVDAVTGPALMFYPRKIITDQGSTVVFIILAEEVINLTATEFTVKYDPAALQVKSVMEGTIFSGNGESLFFTEIDNQQGMVTVSSGIWGGTYPAITGTGDIVELEIQVLKQGEAAIGFSGSEVFRDPENNTIPILETVGGVVTQ